ncbi:MAG: hypothetical protein U0325_09470 [Polyangiales bacterium]
MSALPGPFARWSALVADLPRDVADALLPWMELLARSLGPLRAQVRVGEGDPDGVDGVTRRGPFDRLLDTERLLATEVPDEFVRRAAQSELLFHALALKDLKPPRASLMLVDAGPAQLGAPRLVHLALVLVMAARARDAGARFAWGLLQDPPADGRPPKLVSGVEPPLPALVLLDRRALPPCADDLHAWEAFALRAGWDDVWWVGEDLRPSKRLRGGAVRVRDPVRPGVTRLDVEVEHGGRVIPRALALPDPALQARVLRDPRMLFAKPAPPPPPRPVGGVGRAEDVPATPPLFLAEGRRLVARNAQGDPLIFAVPTEGTKGGRPKRWNRPSGEQVLAVGWFRRRLVLLTRRGDALLRFDWQGDVFPMVSAPLREVSPSVLEALRARPADAALLALRFPHAGASPDTALVHLDDGRALAIARNGVVRVLHERALCLAETRGRVVLVGTARPEGPPAVPGLEVVSVPENRRAALVGSSWHHRYVVATRGEDPVWRVEGVPAEEMRLLPGDTPLGLVGAGVATDPFRVVALDEDRRAVVACGAARAPLLRAGEALLGASLDGSGFELAVVATTGALRVFRLPEMSPRFVRGPLEVRW